MVKSIEAHRFSQDFSNNMALVDILILIIVLGFLFFGLSVGFAQMISSLFGTIIGLVVASNFTESAFAAWGGWFGGGPMGKVIIFVLLFGITAKALWVIFWFLGKIFDILAWIPFAGFLDRLLGALAGVVEGLLAVGGILYFAANHMPFVVLLPVLQTSAVAKILIAVVSALSVLGPSAVENAQKTIEAAKAGLNNLPSSPITF